MSVPRFRNPLRSAPGLCALALCAFALLPMAPASAAVRTVSNCNNSGQGSLRAAVAGAASGDTINLAALECRRIVLTSGQIQVAQDNLELVGRNSWSLTIDGNRAGRVFAHRGAGILRVKRLSITNGRHEALSVKEVAKGGCIYSDGAVELIGSQVHHCAAVQDMTVQEANAQGGGVFAQRLVRLSYSRVFANTAGIYGLGGGVGGGDIVLQQSQVYGNRVDGEGGGVVAYGRAEVVHSVVRDNQATYGGGIYGFGRLTVRKSTISGNRAVPRDFLGGVFSSGGGIYANNPQGRSTVIDSTISGNSAHDESAALFMGDAAIYNSTVTANEENGDHGTGSCQGRGAVSGEMQLRLESTIVAGNSCTFQGENYDVGAGSVVGSHNLIGTSNVPVPADTIATSPRLGPLANNGGPTPTHALLSGSPAIDRGSNLLRSMYDQRGPGFPRVKGLRADIGAYER
jgi:hypothetical protein